ncbi:MAG: glycoside hydrolase family 95 protein [Saprospiraceae bacterium]|nr:glycoside hydrolase family 95 protein [Saprospiraceae bacterium]
MRQTILKTICVFCFFTSLSAQSDKTLMYTKPAEYFEETLVLGNGKMGASVHGGIVSDKIFLNDATLWSGEPIDAAKINPEAHKHLPSVRQALKDENYRLADSLNCKLQGKFSESFAPLGTLFIDMRHDGQATNYQRTLSLSDAISTTRYTLNGVQYTREYFISHPNQVMVIRLTASQKGKLGFSLRFKSLLQYNNTIKNEVLQSSGRAPIHAEPSYRGNMPNAIVYAENKGTRFTNLVKIVKHDGTFAATDSTIGIQNGSEAIILVALATSFNGFDKDPYTEGVNDLALATQNLTAAQKVGFQILKQTHIKDYQQFFNRVDLKLNGNPQNNKTTEERLIAYRSGASDPSLEVLYFNFGRYLLISSSRTPRVPANLQGIWNPIMRPPWSSNYTTNINAEMNYWLAESCNLSEMHQSLLGFIENLSKTGVFTAKNFYNARGWCVAHNSDIWAMSNPVGDYGQGSPSWANWNMGGAWLATHLWEHFTFTQDKDFLEKKAYNLMRSAAEFCLDMLVDDGKGHLITSPATSPENVVITPTGYVAQTTYGTTSDLAMIRELFLETIEAAKILGKDTEFQKELEAKLAKLYPYQIGKKGNLQEWYHDWEDKEPLHRHQSQLYGLYPAHHISVEKTPELAAACRKTLEIKGDETTGWSKGWRTNLWARLHDGNHTYKMYRELLRYVTPDGMGKTSYSGGGGTYPNLFDAHPPFQIDGNFGGTAAVAEMLVQSGLGKIELLPALPDAWTEGSVKGLCARGGFVLDLVWANNKLVSATVFSKKGGDATVSYGKKQQKINVKKGSSIKLTF